MSGELLTRTGEHLFLTAISALAAVVVGIPLGIIVRKCTPLRGPVLGIAGVVQTIPSVAMLALLMVPLGLGVRPAIGALILYALLPIIINTYTGLNEVDRAVLEAADGLGFTAWQRLFLIEIPLAGPVIIAGIRTAVVLTVGIATLSALIGAGGLGVLIFRGLSTGNTNSIMLGVIAAAGMAVLLGYGMDFIGNRLKKRLHQE